MWRFETLQKSTANFDAGGSSSRRWRRCRLMLFLLLLMIFILLFGPPIIIIIITSTTLLLLLHLNFSALPPRNRHVYGTAGLVPTNKEPAVNALGPGKSECRLQDGFSIRIICCRRNFTSALIEDDKRNLEPRGKFFAKTGYLEKGDGSMMPWIAAALLLLFRKESK